MLCCAIGGALVVSVMHEARLRFAFDLKASDLVTLLLAGAGLILTAVGIFVAILAFWGWSSIRNESVSASRAEASTITNTYLNSDEFNARLEAQITNFLQQNAGSPEFRALLQEREREQRDMSDLDARGVDNAWGMMGEDNVDPK